MYVHQNVIQYMTDRLHAVKTHPLLSLCDQGLQESIQDESKRESLTGKYLERFAMETTAVFASSRLLDDGVILPQKTREVCRCLF